MESSFGGQSLLDSEGLANSIAARSVGMHNA